MDQNNLSQNQAFNILKQTFLFKKFDNNMIGEKIKKYPLIQWQKNKIIDNIISLKYAFIIIKGRLKITKIDPKTGRSISLFILTSGDIYDFFTLLDGKEHIVFPIPIDDVIMFKIPIQEMRTIIEDYPEFNISFLPYLGQKMRELENFGKSLVFDDTATRLSKLILKHVSTDKEKEDFCYPVKLISNLSHETLSEMVGSVRSVITTQMQKLKKEDIIINKKGHLFIKNLEKLKTKCDSFLED